MCEIPIKFDETHLVGMRVAILYLPFEDGNETKVIGNRYHWNLKYLSDCVINKFPFFNQKRNRLTKKQRDEVLEASKLINRITIIGFVNNDCPIENTKRNLLMV